LSFLAPFTLFFIIYILEYNTESENSGLWSKSIKVYFIGLLALFLVFNFYRTINIILISDQRGNKNEDCIYSQLEQKITKKDLVISNFTETLYAKTKIAGRYVNNKVQIDSIIEADRNKWDNIYLLFTNSNPKRLNPDTIKLSNVDTVLKVQDIVLFRLKE
jgi:hypothetical protein